MKHNAKEVVNIITLVDEYIKTLNKRCKEHKVLKIYEVKIVDDIHFPTDEQIKKGEKSKKCKRIKLIVINIETRDRITLFSLDYIINNPAVLLSSSYKRTLYRELLFNAFGVFCFNIEASLKAREENKEPNIKDFTPVEHSE